MANPISNLGTIPTITVGSRVFTDLTNLIILYGYAGTNTACTPRKWDGSSGYTPSGATKYVCHAVKCTSFSVTPARSQFGSASSDVGMDSGSLPSSPVYVAGSSAVQELASGVSGSTGASPYETALYFEVPNTKYAFCNGTSGIDRSYLLYGYEV